MGATFELQTSGYASSITVAAPLHVARCAFTTWDGKIASMNRAPFSIFESNHLHPIPRSRQISLADFPRNSCNASGPNSHDTRFHVSADKNLERLTSSDGIP